MAFTIDRVEAARRLGVSTRTVDRHIQADRIRTKRIGKKIYLDDEDVEKVRTLEPAREQEDYVVIYDDEPKSSDTRIVDVRNSPQMVDYGKLYTEAQSLIAKKDEVIQDLSYRLGKSETELKNSISLIDYKQATFLLESAKHKSIEDEETMSAKIKQLEKDVEKRNSAINGLSILLILVLVFSCVFFFYTKLPFSL